MALSANYQAPHRGYTPGKVEKLGVTGATNYTSAHIIYKGAVCMSDVSLADGYAHAMQASGTVAATATDVFVGIALDRVSISATELTDGLKDVSLARDGVWGFPVSSLAITDIGAIIYMSDDNVPTTTTANNLNIGTLVDVDATYAWVNISAQAGNLSTGTT